MNAVSFTPRNTALSLSLYDRKKEMERLEPDVGARVDYRSNARDQLRSCTHTDQPKFSGNQDVCSPFPNFSNEET